jgi:hypothetical protein
VCRVKVVKDVESRADSHHESLSETTELVVERVEAVRGKQPLPFGHVGLLPEPGLGDIEREYGAFSRGARQGAVVVCPQVALEPYDDHVRSFGYQRRLPRRGRR